MRRTLLWLVVGGQLLMGQLVPSGFGLHKRLADSTASYFGDTTSVAGLASNSIVDIRPAEDSLLFFGTSGGLSLTPDLGASFRSYIADSVHLPEGGISALAVLDSIIVVAAFKDTTEGFCRCKGTGLAFSADLGNTWTYLLQPREPRDSTTIHFTWGGTLVTQQAITTTVDNLTYDVAVTRDYIWAASYAGGLRRYSFDAEKWSLIPLPPDTVSTFACDDTFADFEWNVLDNLNHRVFSVIAYDSLVWVGTAAGINKGIVDPNTGCVDWTHYSAKWDNISGNFVVGLHRQIAASGERIWAATVNTKEPSEFRAVSYTADDGATWTIPRFLVGKRPYNIHSFGESVYVAAEDGLYKSNDGTNWARFHVATDYLTGEQVWAEQVYGALFDARDSTLWVGTPDGLARTRNAGISWEIERSFVSTTTPGEARLYAYPNPFYLAEDNIRDGAGHVRLQYHISVGEVGTTARISIYDFAMDPVVSLSGREHNIAGDFSQVWDGRNEAGYKVANGVYYCQLTLGQTEYWTKVIVIK